MADHSEKHLDRPHEDEDEDDDEEYTPHDDDCVCMECIMLWHGVD